MDSDGLMTYGAAMRHLAVSRTTLWELVRAGHFRVFSHRGLRRLYVSDVVAYRDAHTRLVGERLTTSA